MPESFKSSNKFPERREEPLKYFVVEITSAPGWPRIEKLYMGRSKEQVLKTARGEYEGEYGEITEDVKFDTHEISESQYRNIQKDEVIKRAVHLRDQAD